MSIKHEHTLNPITALEFYPPEATWERSGFGSSWRPWPLLILAGEGSFLKVFDAETSKLLCQCRIFNGQSIHGIVVSEAIGSSDGLQVAIWGGCCLSLYTKSQFSHLLGQEVESFAESAIVVPDWILDVALPSDAVSCLFITAHNTVFEARLAEYGRGSIVKALSSPSRSILYSAHLVCQHSQILVAAGTVFGEIIVWECKPSGANRVLFTFTGHEGSIFGVNISPIIYHSDGSSRRLLASCSDDRTIRVWDLASSSTNTLQENSAIALRETGFGQNNIDRSEGRCVATIMGHASRIWAVKFSPNSSLSHESTGIDILSFGEDSTTQQWELDFLPAMQLPEASGSLNSSIDSQLSHQKIQTSRFKHVNTFAFHSGKHIWSTAIHRKDDLTYVLATGGADGKTSLYEVRTLYDRRSRAVSPKSIGSLSSAAEFYSSDLEDALKHCSHRVEPIPPTLTEAPLEVELIHGERMCDKALITKKPTQVHKDAFNRYAIVNEDVFYATTNFGRILTQNAPRTSRPKWEEVQLPDSGRGDLKSYSVMKAIPEFGLVYLAGSNGKIYVCWDGSRTAQVGQVQGKVADMFKIFRSKASTFELLVTILGGQTATLFLIDDSNEEEWPFLRSIEHQLPEKFVVTSAGRSNNLLVLGSRSGSLALYDPENPLEPLTVWKSTKNVSEDAITSILELPNSGSINHSRHFLTTSRDGTYSIFSYTIVNKLEPNTKSANVRRVHQSSPPFGPMIESAWFNGSDLLMNGFKSKNFVVWNETKQSEVMNVECGGAHRSYAYLASAQLDGGKFICTKASKLHLYNEPHASHQIIKQGGHGREIKSCAVSADRGLIATGAEDTCIRIWEYTSAERPTENQFCCKAVIQKHTAGIQHLQWYGSNYLFSSGGNEEFFVWAIESIPGFGIGVICEATCPDRSEEKDLRIMGFDVIGFPSILNPNTDGRLLVSLAYSDSTIRMYTYSQETGFLLLAKGRYSSACLMQIRHIKTSDNEINILTAATDGNLVLWTAANRYGSPNGNDDLQSNPSTLSILSICKLHQNAIKSLDFMPFGDNILVATGGDDNAFGISIYSSQRLSAGPSCFTIRRAHAAAITGICFVRTNGFEYDRKHVRVVTSSNDQKVKEWDILVNIQDSGDECGVIIKKVGEVFTNVADVGDLEMLNGGEKVLVVGNGMEIWKVSC